MRRSRIYSIGESIITVVYPKTKVKLSETTVSPTSLQVCIEYFSAGYHFQVKVVFSA